MRAVIKNRVYETDGAARLGSWRSGVDPTKFYYEQATLYKTPKGACFLEWGRMSPLEDEIEPLTREQALRWAQQHGIMADIIEFEFGDLITEA